MYYFGNDCFACQADAHLIVADLGKDKFWCIEPPRSNAIAEWIEHLAEGRSQNAFNNVGVPNRIVRLGQRGVSRISHDSADRDLGTAVHNDKVPLLSERGPALIVRFLVSWLYGLWAKRHGRYRLESRGLADRPPQAESMDEAAGLYAATRQFELLSTLVFSDTSCLQRSLALRHYLYQLGYETHLVIGVQVAPFYSHCWLQYKGTILGDRLDFVRAFTPVAVL